MKESLKSPLTLASTLLILGVALSACSPPGEATSPAGLPAASPPTTLVETNPSAPDFVWKCPDGSTEFDIYSNKLNIQFNKAAFDEELTPLCNPKNPKIKMPIIFNTNPPVSSKTSKSTGHEVGGHPDYDEITDNSGKVINYKVHGFTIETDTLNKLIKNADRLNEPVGMPCEYSTSSSCRIEAKDLESALNLVLFHELEGHAMRYFEGLTPENWIGTEAPATHDTYNYYQRLLSGKAKKLLSCSETTCMAKK